MVQVPAVPAAGTPFQRPEGLMPVGVLVVNESSGGAPEEEMTMIECASPLPECLAIWVKILSRVFTIVGVDMKISLIAVVRCVGFCDRVMFVLAFARAAPCIE